MKRDGDICEELLRRAGGRTGSPHRQPMFHTPSPHAKAQREGTKQDDDEVEVEPSAAARRALAEARALLRERPSFIELLVGVFGACRQMSPDQLRSFCFMALASAPTAATPATPATPPTSAARVEAFDDLLNIDNREKEHNISYEGYTARRQQAEDHAESPHQSAWASSSAAAASARYVAEETTPTMPSRPATRLADHRSDGASDTESNSGSSDGDDLLMPASVGFKRPRDASAPPSPYTRPPEPAPPSSDGSSSSSDEGEEGSDDDDGSSSHWSSAQEAPLTPDGGAAAAGKNIRGEKEADDVKLPDAKFHGALHAVAQAADAQQQQCEHDDEWPDVEALTLADLPDAPMIIPPVATSSPPPPPQLPQVSVSVVANRLASQHIRTTSATHGCGTPTNHPTCTHTPTFHHAHISSHLPMRCPASPDLRGTVQRRHSERFPCSNHLLEVT